MVEYVCVANACKERTTFEAESWGDANKDVECDLRNFLALLIWIFMTNKTATRIENIVLFDVSAYA